MVSTLVPVLQTMVDWRNNGFNFVTNANFGTSTTPSTTGWVVTVGINAVGTSITGISTDAYVGSCSATLVTGATSGAGANFDFGVTQFRSGRQYTYSVWVNRNSGTTAAKVTLGSLGTGADRSTTTAVLGSGWQQITGTWTPSANRTDVEIAVMNNAASSGNWNIDHIEVYETINDISADISAIQWSRGANLDGTAEVPGFLNLTVKSTGSTVLGKYNKRNTASVLYDSVNSRPMVVPGKRIWVRATFNGVVYGVFFGSIRRVVPNPMDGTCELICEDLLYNLSIVTYRQYGIDSDTYQAFRARILDASMPDVPASAHYSLPASTIESGSLYSYADTQSALSILAAINKALASMHWIEPNASSDLLYRYSVRDRDELILHSYSQVYGDDGDAATIPIADSGGWDDTDEALVNKQRVQPHPISQTQAYAVIHTAPNMPVNIAANTTFSYYYEDPQFLSSAGNTTTGPVALATCAGATKTYTYFPKAVYIEVAAGGSARSLTAITISAKKAKEQKVPIKFYEDTASQAIYGKIRGDDIDNPYVQTPTKAVALATAIVNRYSTPRAKPNITIWNQFPSQVVRQVGQRVRLNYSRLSLVSEPYVIRSYVTTVAEGGLDWKTVLQLEEIP